MPNPNAPTEGAGRRIPFIVDPDNPGVAYLAAGEGGIDMGAGRTDGAAAYVLPPPADTSTRTSVAADDADTPILDANVLRRGFAIFNDATVTLYLGLGAAAASATDFSVQIPPDGYYEPPSGIRFTGEVRGIWPEATGAAAYGNARVTEFTSEGWAGS
jgi:hypothetical protein